MKNRSGKRPPQSKEEYCYEHPRPSVTVDIVLFYCETEDSKKILLIKRGREPFKGMWALPGGFVDKDESLERAAVRELEEETGVRRVRLEQFGAFGDPGRDPRGHTVSVGFTARLKKCPEVKGSDDADEARWCSVMQLPRLAFDHKKLIRAALRHAFGESRVQMKKSSA
ncbi:MAG TPA: NUDIX hydrolase [Blastocatellia bacterium]|nr:NUDIX hydrolase [Blastocatellia bacterium]